MSSGNMTCCQNGEMRSSITFAEFLGLSVETCVAWIGSQALDSTAHGVLAEVGGPGAAVVGFAESIVGDYFFRQFCEKSSCQWSRGEGRSVFDGVEQERMISN